LLLSPSKTLLWNSTVAPYRATLETDRGFPSPRQFQLKGFMAPGGAALQPLPISHHFGLSPLCLLVVASSEELLVFILQILTSQLS